MCLLLAAMIQTDKNNDDNQVTPTHSDFSIDHILNRAGSSNYSRNCNSVGHNCDQSLNSATLDALPWLQCTRYCPPRLPRTQRREGPQKRQLGRHPRIPFTTYQLQILEDKYQESPYLSSEEVIILSKKLDLTDIRVKIWFQNRRARERREKSQPVPEEQSGSPVPATTTSPKHVYSLLAPNLNSFTIFEQCGLPQPQDKS